MPVISLCRKLQLQSDPDVLAGRRPLHHPRPRGVTLLHEDPGRCCEGGQISLATAGQYCERDVSQHTYPPVQTPVCELNACALLFTSPCSQWWKTYSLFVPADSISLIWTKAECFATQGCRSIFCFGFMQVLMALCLQLAILLWWPSNKDLFSKILFLSHLASFEYRNFWPLNFLCYTI